MLLTSGFSFCFIGKILGANLSSLLSQVVYMGTLKKVCIKCWNRLTKLCWNCPVAFLSGLKSTYVAILKVVCAQFSCARARQWCPCPALCGTGGDAAFRALSDVRVLLHCVWPSLWGAKSGLECDNRGAHPLQPSAAWVIISRRDSIDYLEAATF